jgi:hypothetical protein
VSDEADETAVAIPVDSLEGFPLDIAHRFLRADLVDDLGFEETYDTFGQGVVIGVTDGAAR